MGALVRQLKLPSAMRVRVLPGLIGPTGVTVLKIVMVEFNRELENAKMEKKVIAPDQQLTSSSVI